MTEKPDEFTDDLDPSEDEGPDLSGAYADLMKGLRRNVLPAEELKKLSANFSRAAGLDKLGKIFDPPAARFFPQGMIPPAPSELIIDPPPIDTSPSQTARNTERMAELLEDQKAAVTQLVSLTASSLALTTEQREAAERSERFSRRTTITSIFIAAASLGTSVAALAVAVLIR